MGMAEIAAALRRANENADRPEPITKRRAASLKIPFLDDTPMRGDPSCSYQDFRTPRLRKSCFEAANIDWKSAKAIDGGLDGYVWKVSFGGEGPYALKLFWDAEPPKFEHYHAVQRECQNAALFQMMETSVRRAAAESTPIMVHANPRTKDEALANMRAFSDERRRETASAESSPEMASITSMPRVVKCYGWLKMHTDLYMNMPDREKAPTVFVEKIRREIYSGKEYTAIVYEYVEPGENDPAVVEDVGNFLWLAGFGYVSTSLERNWRDGVLVDLSDIVHPRGFGWYDRLYQPREAKTILRS